MGLLKLAEKQRLTSLLLKLPNINDPGTRRILISDLPGDLRNHIPLSEATNTHIADIINTADSDTWAKLPNEPWSIIPIVQAAIYLSNGSYLAQELQELLNTLNERAEQLPSNTRPVVKKPEPTPRRGLPKIALVGIPVLLMIILVSAAFQVMQNNGNNTAGKQTSTTQADATTTGTTAYITPIISTTATTVLEALITATPEPPSTNTPTAQSTPTPASVLLHVNQDTLSTDPKNVTVKITTVELLPSGIMRWSFLISNDSGRDTLIRLNYSDLTYLTDEHGNRYTMLRDSEGNNPESDYRRELPDQVRANLWIEFPPPINGAKEFAVILDSLELGSADFPTIVVKLDYDQSAIPTTPPTPVIEGIKTLQINQTQYSSDPKNISVTVTSVELMPNGVMRWNFLFSNQSGRHPVLGFDYKDKTYLTDEYGNRYTVLRDKEGNTSKDNYRVDFPDQVRIGLWIDFPAPKDGAKEFTVVLDSLYIMTFDFPTFKVELP